jgi:hypothetical protein
MLTREEVERRLKRWSGVKPDDPSYLRDSGQRDALETALAAMDERDALLAENRLLRDSLALVDDIDGWHLASNVRIALESAFLPRTAAEVERVRRLEAVLEAAEEYRDAEQVQMLNEFKYDEPKYERQQRAKAALDAAIAVYREGERPGGEGDVSR